MAKKSKLKYAVFILTYGRAEKVYTHKSLIKSGYTGPIFLVCSSDDKDLPKYQELYKDQVIVFDKKDYEGTFDIGDNFNDMRVVVYARNACFKIAEELGYEYFIQLDDDYTDFRYKFDDEFRYLDYPIKKNLDRIFDRFFDYYSLIPQCKALAWAQGGDFIGGKSGSQAEYVQIKRKIMNVYFFSTKRKVEFIGRINEDVNTYVSMGNKGELVFQTNQMAINQHQTQSNSGGLTEFYLDGGTYVKSFYSVMFAPSCVKVSMMGSKHRRLHHRVKWNNTSPLIISEDHKK